MSSDPARSPMESTTFDDASNAPRRMTARDHGVEEGVRWATCNAPMYGAVNGYVLVPEGHPWHGLDYDAEELDVRAPGGLTFGSVDGWIGFDTLHFMDLWEGSGQPHYCQEGRCVCTVWTPEMVAEETRALARQVAEAVR